MIKNNLLITTSIVLLFASHTSQASQNSIDYFDLSLEELMQIDITSVSKKEENSFEVAAAIFIITQEDIKRSGMTTIPEILRLAPGVQVAQIDSNKWAVSSRGFNRQYSNKLLVLIDGRSVYTPLFSGVYWDIQDTILDDIERIEVIRGPGATIWGANAVNGVINIITKNTKDTQGTLITSGYGNLEQGFGSVRYGGKSGENLNYRIYAKHNERNNLKTQTNNNANDDWYTSRGGFRLDYNDKNTNSITLQGDAYNGRKNYAISKPIITAPYIDNRITDEEFKGGNILVKWDKDFSDNSKTSLQSYIDYISRNIDLLGQKRLTYDIDFQHTWNINARNQIIWGTGFRYISDSLIDSPQVNYNEDERTDKLFTAFIQDKYAISPNKLYLTIGSKFEINDYTGFEYQPSIRGTWLINDSHTLWASVSRAVRIPSRNEDSINLVNLSVPPNTLLGAGTPAAFASQIGNNSIESEKLIAYEIGLRSKFFDNFSYDIAGFFNDYSNLRTTEGPGAPFLDTRGLPPHLVVPLPLSNFGYGESYGVEISTKWQATDNWRLSANYSFITINLHTDPASTDSTSQKEEGNAPKNQASLISHLNLPYKIALSNSIFYVDNAPGQNVDSYIRFDSNVSWQPTKNIEVSISGLNLLDDSRKEFSESLYASSSLIGRTYYGKVTVSF